MRTLETLAPNTMNRWVSYKMEITQRTQMGVSIDENLVSMEVIKRFTQKDNDGLVYQLSIKNRKQKSAKQLRMVENDLAFLKEELVLRTDHQGKLTAILNLHDIITKWQDYKDFFYTKNKNLPHIEALMEDIDEMLNDPEEFLKTIKQSEVGTLLFPAIYLDELEIGVPQMQKKQFDDFFGETALPLILKTELKKVDRLSGSAHIFRGGVLDEEGFDHQAVKRMFRKLADNIQMAVGVNVDYMETYNLDKHQWIAHAGQLFAVRIKGLYNFEQVVRLTPINKEL